MRPFSSGGSMIASIGTCVSRSIRYLQIASGDCRPSFAAGQPETRPRRTTGRPAGTISCSNRSRSTLPTSGIGAGCTVIARVLAVGAVVTALPQLTTRNRETGNLQLDVATSGLRLHIRSMQLSLFETAARTLVDD